VTAGVTYDSMVDSPTVGATSSNYCVLNPLAIPAGFSITASNGNLDVVFANATYAKSIGSTLSLSTGKSYFEGTVNSGATVSFIGIEPSNSTIFNDTVSSSRVMGYSSTGYSYFSSGEKRNNNTDTAYGASYTTGNIIGVAIDLDNGKIWFSKNNTWQASGDPSAGTNPAFSSIPTNTYISGVSAYGSQGWTLNFGQRPFSYTPPTGFVALNTQNLPAPTISNGAQYMAATTYTGNGSTQNIVNSGGFQPDLVWYKDRSVARDHSLFDSVRGTTKGLSSNLTNAESTYSGVTAFNSNGFSLGSSINGNASTETYVGWQWKAGGTAVSNTAGTITSSVSANPTAGFSVVTYTGTGSAATVGHSLGVAPKMVIVKSRSYAGTQWVVWHTSLTSGAYTVYLNLTNAQASAPTVWNSTIPTSTVFSVGTNADSNNSGSTYVAYCFAEVAGYSKFGSYTGNGSADGPFVYCGFRPRWIMLKASGLNESWFVYDSSRNTYNALDLELNPNNSGAEATFTTLDFVSNGFKLRNTNSLSNQSGATYIYACFAENPLKFSLAR